MQKPRIVFMGTPDFAVTSLRALHEAGYPIAAVVTVPDRQTGRGLKVTYSPVKEYALQHSLPIMQPEKLKDPEFLTELESLKADLFIVVAFRMLPRQVWAMPPMGTFNLHGSLLPRYRGAAPINWAIINGEKETGVTTFLLNEHIDEGAILLSERIPILPDDDVESIHDQLALIGAQLVLRTAEGLYNRSLQGNPQQCPNDITSPHGRSALLAPKIFKADCAIDWKKPGQQIVDFVRGLSPYPAATTIFIDDKGHEQSLKIYKTAFEPGQKHDKNNILSDQKNYLSVSVSDGLVRILSLQMSGKKRISVEEFLRGYNVTNWYIKQ